MAAARLHLDFESRSAADLKQVGLDVYSQHPTTDVWCMAYAFGENPVCLAPAAVFYPNAAALNSVHQFVEKGGLVVAHNAAFELAIWNNVMVPRYGWPVLRPEQVRCTMAMAYAMGLPGSLEKAAAALGITEQKDLAGGRLMLQMAAPRTIADCDECANGVAPKGGHEGSTRWWCDACAGTGKRITWWDDADKLARLHEYCRQDVRVEREIERRMLQLSPREQRVWQLDYAINQRGFHVDKPAIEAALEIARSEKERLDADLRAVTGNFVGFATENARLVQWLGTRGVDTGSVAKAEVLDLLAGDTLPADCRTALLIRQEAGKSSLAKLGTILSALSADGRMRNTMQYHAASTGRWGGRRVQPHNFPRPKIPQETIEKILNALPAGVAKFGPEAVAQQIDIQFGAPLDVLPWCLRGIITAAPGKELMGADFANIEGRGLAWLAGEEWKLDAFRAFDRGEGPDLYLVSATRIHGRPFTEDDPERQHGKVAELACGYQGGVGAFQTMAKTYGVNIADALASEIKTRWREAHPAIVRYWYALEDAALRAAQTDAIISTGPEGRQVRFRKSGSFLWCQLPSGRVLCYPYPQIRQIETPWGDLKDALTYMTVPNPTDKGKGKIVPDPSNRSDWARVSTYGGKLAENVTQAICRDLLADAMLRLEEHGYPVVLHVHDEVVCELPSHLDCLDEFEHLVSTVPAWASGLPIAASGWRGSRYQKG